MNKKNAEKNSEKNSEKNAEKNSELENLFKKNRVVGIIGNQNTAKSSLALNQLLNLKEKHKNLNIYVYGVEPNLQEYLEKNGINFLHNMEDITDLKIKNSIIYIDEISNFVSTSTKNKQTDKFKRFINRIVHLNCFLLLSTAETKFWNSLACSMINAVIVKEIELDYLTNGTWVKRMVKGLPRTSEYRVDMPINTFYVLQNEQLTIKGTFEYNPNLDSKKNNINPFK